ncbi:hypothetical protein IGI04_006059 [Brassica rapa subsp. trilocularis]|uniref:Uncharacterized protein n=1 Tax=Brassica rapa subsp. trilocularis TaxID=1813537 RepID=A0ABQ7NFT6_BRACM|nr:hypothetical protein IGI04_006059 [Brassica rapa subsp. trilocularis]
MHPKPHRNHRYTLVQWNTLELVHFFHHYKPIKHFIDRTLSCYRWTWLDNLSCNIHVGTTMVECVLANILYNFD